MIQYTEEQLQAAMSAQQTLQPKQRPHQVLRQRLWHVSVNQSTTYF